jgi:hypothetical protein
MASREEEEGSSQEKKTKKKKKGSSSSILAVPSSNTRRRRQGSTIGGGKSESTAPRLSNDKRAKSNRKRAEKERESGDDSEIDHNAKEAKQPNVDEVRRARAEYYASPPKQRQQRDAITGTEAPTMPYVSETVIRERIPEEETRHYSKRRTGGGKERRTRDEVESRHSRSRRKVRVAEEEEEYVYGRPREAMLEEYSTEDEDDAPVSGLRSRYTQTQREPRPSAPRRRSEPVAESSRSSHRPGAKVESRRSSYKEDTPSRRYTTRGESRRRISRDGTVYETRPIKTTRVTERVLPLPLPLPLRRLSEPLWRSTPGRRGSESTVEQMERVESSSRNDRPRVTRYVYCYLFPAHLLPSKHPSISSDILLGAHPSVRLHPRTPWRVPAPRSKDQGRLGRPRAASWE